MLSFLNITNQNNLINIPEELKTAYFIFAGVCLLIAFILLFFTIRFFKKKLSDNELKSYEGGFGVKKFWLKNRGIIFAILTVVFFLIAFTIFFGSIK